MRIAAAETMRKIDSYTINSIGIPGVVLMENAALKVVKNIPDKFKKLCIVCSRGNNGGDGFAAARHLFLSLRQVEVFLIGGAEGMSEDCSINYQAAKNMGISITDIKSSLDLDALKDSVTCSDMVVDAIFGTGLTRNVEGLYAKAIDIINKYKQMTLSIDVPSGMESDSGRVLGTCIRADITVTLQLLKQGFLSYGADDYTGRVILEDIGIPGEAVDKFHQRLFYVDKEQAVQSLKARNKYSHKGDFGRVLIIAGSEGYTGAAFICAQAAIKSGSGLVTLCCPKNIRDVLCSKLTEAMTCTFDEEDKLYELIDRADAIAIGPGLGNHKDTLAMVEKVLNRAKCTVVMDADAINVLKNHMELLENKGCSVVMTPHPGELSRITELHINYINENRIEVSEKFAREHNAILLLKGYNTVITDGRSLYVNSSGNSAMASGGMGDALTGIIASLSGQGYDPLTAAYLGAFIHGYAGCRLSQSMFSVSAAQVAEYIPYIMKELLQK